MNLTVLPLAVDFWQLPKVNCQSHVSLSLRVRNQIDEPKKNSGLHQASANAENSETA
jgi:hypothetical protein